MSLRSSNQPSELRCPSSRWCPKKMKPCLSCLSWAFRFENRQQTDTPPHWQQLCCLHRQFWPANKSESNGGIIFSLSDKLSQVAGTKQSDFTTALIALPPTGFPSVTIMTEAHVFPRTINHTKLMVQSLSNKIEIIQTYRLQHFPENSEC